MEVKKILEVAQSGYREFLDIWRRHRKTQGPGALVFMSADIPDEGDDITCEYWTIGDLRRYVRTMNECDEVVYKWLTEAVREGGYPVVIFSAVRPETIETIRFVTVTSAKVS